MKKLILYFQAVVPAMFFFFGATALKAQTAFPCDSFCVEKIWLDSINPSMVHVVCHNASSRFISYPILQFIDKGDTVINRKATLEYYGQMPNSRMKYTMETSLKSIPSGFSPTVMLYSSSIKKDTCIISYPCSTFTSLREELNTTTSFSIYPNPASAVLHIESSETITTPLYARIYSMEGKEMLSIIFSGNDRELSINTQAFTKGIYVLTITGSNSVYTTRFFKE